MKKCPLTVDGGAPRLLIVKLSSLGDVVHALPVASALRRRYPGAFLGWCVGRAAAPLVAHHPLLDVVFVLGRGTVAPGERVVVAEGYRELGRALRQYHFEVSLDLQGLLRSAYLAYLGGAPCRVGYRNWQEGAFLFNRIRAVPPARDRHAVQGYLDFARYLDAPAEPVEFVLPTDPQAAGTAERLLSEFSAPGRAALLLPGARWESKHWPPDRFGQVAAWMAGQGLAPLVAGSAQDQALAERVVSASGGKAASIAGRTSVADLAALVARSRLVVGHDSGPVHLAAALGVPLVSIFGPTNPALTGPYGRRVEIVRAAVACSPCRRRRCRSLVCQERVSVEMVTAAASRLLQGQP